MSSKCQIQWIDENGKATPDQNDAVMFAHFHEPVFAPMQGRILRYKDQIQDSYFICADHYSKVTADMRMPHGGWSFSPLPELDGRKD